MASNRLQWVDSMKGILILMVVMGHAVQYCLPMSYETNYCWNLIYSFHMPAFMALSGWLLKNGENFTARIGGGISYKSLFVKRTLQLFVPFLCWTLVACAIQCRFSLRGIVGLFLQPDGSFWFLWVLYIISTIFYISNWLSKKTKVYQEIYVIVVALLMVVLMVWKEIRVCGFQFIAYYFLFFALGYYMNKYERFFIKKNWLISGLFVFWFFLASFWNMHSVPCYLRNVFSLPATVINYSYRFLTAVVFIYVMFAVAPHLPIHKKIVEWIAWIGKHTLGVYVIHLLFVPPIAAWLLKNMVEVPIVIPIILSFVIVLWISLFLTVLLGKLPILKLLLLGKTK